MCGICGVVRADGGPVDEGLLRRMASTLRHRGPDGEGYRTGPGWGFGHRRLAIIDLAGGAQPMSNEDSSVWITYNGEVYNFAGIARRLRARGHVFRTRCDTEVLVHLYEERGERLVEDLRGMFAFGIWDARERRLLLARDRAGKKPLYFAEAGGNLWFASEMKALLEVPEIPRDVDREAIDLYLTYQYVPRERTIFRSIRRLLPAHLLVWKAGRSRTERYWDIDFRRKTSLSLAEAREEFRRLLLEATRLRLVSDVPLGAFLSGGIDSSAVVAAMAEASSAPVKTFSIGFPEADYTETRYAKMVADRFGTDHTEFTVEPKALEVLPSLVWHYDQPFADSSAIPTYYVSKVTRAHVTVALNGDGGDELFAGYDRYRGVLLAERARRVLPEGLRTGLHRAASVLPEGAGRVSYARRLRRFLEAVTTDDAAATNLRLFGYFDEAMKADLYTPEMRAATRGAGAPALYLDAVARAPADDLLDRLLYTDVTNYLADCLLVKVDVASMAVSLECRSPFLDHEVMEFAASLPAAWKVRGPFGKWFLRRAYEEILPRPILERGKMGFGVPIAPWFRGEMRGYLRDVLLDPASLRRGYFRREAVEALIAEHERGARNHAHRLWALLALEMWHRVVLERSVSPS